MLLGIAMVRMEQQVPKVWTADSMVLICLVCVSLASKYFFNCVMSHSWIILKYIENIVIPNSKDFEIIPPDFLGQPILWNETNSSEMVNLLSQS